MTTGDIRRINLSTSMFERLIAEGQFFVDKTRLIEHFLSTSSDVSLIARQRRLGKSLNMDMLRCFLTDKEDFRHLFKGLYVEKSPVWCKANSSPAFGFDFKGLTQAKYKMYIFDMVAKHLESYCEEGDMPRAVRRYVSSEDFDNPEGLRYLTEAVHKVSGKRSYIFIDEYDKLLIDSFKTEAYAEIRSFMTALFQAAMKGNPYLEKALLTGVLRISHESMFSGLNNIETFDVFRDATYTDDYGFTEDEVSAINQLTDFDADKLREWYNGVRIGGKPIYNTYSVMSFMKNKSFSCYWGRSGTMDIITELLDDGRRAMLAKLLSGEEVWVSISDRISLQELFGTASDQAFYSLLVQAGYLALCHWTEGQSSLARLSIPNVELMRVWKDFILEKLHPDTQRLRTLFDNLKNPEAFACDVQHFLQDRLSYHDLAAVSGESPRKVQERVYHVFFLGLLSAYDSASCRRPSSNRESGDGRSDIEVERPEADVIFELKACKKEDDLEATAEKALAQIVERRYGADLVRGKPLVKVGVAFFGKQCCVKVKHNA